MKPGTMRCGVAGRRVAPRMSAKSLHRNAPRFLQETEYFANNNLIYRNLSIKLYYSNNI